VKVNELLNIFHFQDDVTLKCTYKFLMFKYYSRIHQLFNEKVSQPYFEKVCEDETHTPETGTWESSETPKTSKFDCWGQNTSHRVFFISLENYRSVDVENGLAWAIWTSVTQVMAKTKAWSQTGSLTPDH